MSEASAVVIGIVGICVTVINGMGLFILCGIRGDLKAAKAELQKELEMARATLKAEIADIWKRVYKHGHEVICSNDSCHPVKLGGVIVPQDKD